MCTIRNWKMCRGTNGPFKKQVCIFFSTLRKENEKHTHTQLLHAHTLTTLRWGNIHNNAEKWDITLTDGDRVTPGL